ncbi:taurine ABC transporter permease, partial [Elstera litoralis]
YKAEGLDVTIDSGQGSAGAVNRVASSAYELGFADVNALIEYNAANADKAIKAVMMVYDFPPFGVYALKSSGITKPADLVGKTLGAPVFDASYKLFPAFAQKVGIDAAAVPRKNMDPSLREAMLVRKEVDFISGHYFSSFLDLKAKGVKGEDIVAMRYSDFGMDFYGNGLIASPKIIAEKPEAVKGFIRATIKGLKDMIADPKAGIAATKKKDPLIEEPLEMERLELAISTNIVTPNVKRDGIGGVDMARLKRSIDQVPCRQ